MNPVINQSTVTTRGEIEGESLAVNRTAWGAIWAGFFVALGVEVLFSWLMVGVFSSMVHPGGGTPSGTTFGIGLGLWIFAQSLVALYLGGWVAGRLANKPDRRTGGVHGLTVWGITTATLALMIFLVASSAVNTTLRATTNAMGVAGANAPAAVAPYTRTNRLGNAVNNATNQNSVGSAAAAAGNAAESIGSVALSVMVWFPIFLFITAASSLGMAVLGGAVGSTPREVAQQVSR